MSEKPQSKGVVYGTFAIIVLVLALSNMSQTACNSMMVALGAELGVAEETGQWLTTAYMLVIGITVPAVAFLSKRFSNRTLMLAACALFLCGCALDAFARGFAALLCGRILQALCAGITMPLVQGYASVRFPAHLRATGMGIAGIALGFAPNVGPVLGGLFASNGSWRLFFAATALVSLMLTVATLLVAPRERAAGELALDVPSLALSTLGFGGMLLVISNASSAGLASPLLWAPLAVGAVFVVLFFWRQRHAESPLISLLIFSSRRFVGVLADKLVAPRSAGAHRRLHPQAALREGAGAAVPCGAASGSAHAASLGWVLHKTARNGCSAAARAPGPVPFRTWACWGCRPLRSKGQQPPCSPSSSASSKRPQRTQDELYCIAVAYTGRLAWALWCR